MNNSNIFSDFSLENFHILEKGISKYIISRFVNLAKKSECEECIEYIIRKRNSPNELQIALFDLLMREYVWHMGEAMYKCKNDIKQAFIWFGALVSLFSKNDEKFEKKLNNWEDGMGKFFVNIYKELNKFSYVILKNLIFDKIITKNEYDKLIVLFVKNNHVEYENLRAPIGHMFHGEKFIDIILTKGKENLLLYYNSHYKGYNFLSKGFKGDYFNYFYDMIPETIIGNKNIYQFISTTNK